MDPPVFHFVPLLLVLLLGTIEKSLASPFLHPPFRYLYTLMRSPLSLLFSKLTSSSSLSFSSQKGCSSPFIIFVALHWTLSNTSVYLLYWGAQHWTQHSRYGLTSTEQRGRITSLDLLAILHLMLATVPLTFATGAHFWLAFNLVTTRTPESFSAKLLSSWVAPAYVDAWACSSPGAGSCTSPCWTSWGSCQPSSL